MDCVLAALFLASSLAFTSRVCVCLSLESTVPLLPMGAQYVQPTTK